MNVIGPITDILEEHVRAIFETQNLCRLHIVAVLSFQEFRKK